MNRTLPNWIKFITAAAVLLIVMAMTPVSAQAGTEGEARVATIATVEPVLEAQFPEGMPWNSATKYVTRITINGQTLNYTGSGCAGFAVMFAETCFGKNGSYTRTANCALGAISVGDIVRVPNATGGHTYIILTLDETGATIAEANYNGAVHYGRHVTNDELMTNEYVMHHA